MQFSNKLYCYNKTILFKLGWYNTDYKMVQTFPCDQTWGEEELESLSCLGRFGVGKFRRTHTKDDLIGRRLDPTNPENIHKNVIRNNKLILT